MPSMLRKVLIGAATTAVAAVAGGCGGATNTGDDVVLVYRPHDTGRAVRSSTLDATMEVLRRRLVRLGVKGAAVEREGAGRLAVTLPDRGTADRLKGTLGVSGLLRVYDWEANVLGPDGRRHPKDVAVTGGQAAGQPGAGSLTPEEAQKVKAEALSRGVGAVILRAESDPRDRASVALARDARFVLVDRAALTGEDLTDVRVDEDQQTGQPSVVFGFTDAGRADFEAVTRRIARRGAAAATPGVPAMSVANHFAIVLDDALISVPYIDAEQNPDGIDGENGSQISGSFTRASAQRLAALLVAGPLPAPLDLVDEHDR